jgi:hypothetical protein
MSRTARLAAAALLATGLATAVPTGPAAAAGWQFIDTYPTKSECFQAGQAGDGQQWDDFRCTEHIGPLSGGGGWDLWVVVWVG